MSDSLNEVLRGLRLVPPNASRSPDDYYRFFAPPRRPMALPYGLVAMAVLVVCLGAFLR